ncbi:MAG: hypothetical protein FGF48_10920 [Candidatus Brockarchaeota archaeon]|nr:hypothetical protein [Candidatus Brockarchaeota archaeon]MBS7635250.1 hypothetical protein [Candidatus Bathyarchaeota archaeon]
MSGEKLAEFLRSGKDWARMRTSVQGVFVLKLPAYRGSPSRLAIELNPVGEDGSPKKRRGLVLRSQAELDEYRELFQYDKLAKLMELLESVNPKAEEAKRRRGEEVIEI